MTTCSLLSCDDLAVVDRDFDMAEYEGAVARWCPGCGDYAILSSVQRLLAAEDSQQLLLTVTGDARDSDDFARTHRQMDILEIGTEGVVRAP